MVLAADVLPAPFFYICRQPERQADVSLSSSSTISNAIDQYNDNLSWEGNLTKAGLALEAVRFILANRPKVIATNDRNINFETLLGEKEKLESFVSRFSSSVNRCSFTRARALL